MFAPGIAHRLGGVDFDFRCKAFSVLSVDHRLFSSVETLGRLICGGTIKPLPVFAGLVLGFCADLLPNALRWGPRAPTAADSPSPSGTPPAGNAPDSKSAADGSTNALCDALPALFGEASSSSSSSSSSEESESGRRFLCDGGWSSPSSLSEELSYWRPSKEDIVSGVGATALACRELYEHDNGRAITSAHTERANHTGTVFRWTKAPSTTKHTAHSKNQKRNFL